MNSVNSDDDLARAIREGEILAAENQRLQSQLREATEKYAAMRDSLSWRVDGAAPQSALDLLLALRGKIRGNRLTQSSSTTQNYRRWILHSTTGWRTRIARRSGLALRGLPSNFRCSRL
jgi:hypothetical protein